MGAFSRVHGGILLYYSKKVKVEHTYRGVVECAGDLGEAVVDTHALGELGELRVLALLGRLKHALVGVRRTVRAAHCREGEESTFKCVCVCVSVCTFVCKQRGKRMRVYVCL